MRATVCVYGWRARAPAMAGQAQRPAIAGPRAGVVTGGYALWGGVRHSTRGRRPGGRGASQTRRGDVDREVAGVVHGAGRGVGPRRPVELRGLGTPPRRGRVGLGVRARARRGLGDGGRLRPRRPPGQAPPGHAAVGRLHRVVGIRLPPGGARMRAPVKYRPDTGHASESFTGTPFGVERCLRRWSSGFFAVVDGVRRECAGDLQVPMTMCVRSSTGGWRFPGRQGLTVPRQRISV